MLFIKSGGGSSYSEYTVLSPGDLSAMISALDNTPRKIYLKNGNYSISSSIDLTVKNIEEIRGESLDGVILDITGDFNGFNLGANSRTHLSNFTVLANNYVSNTSKVISYSSNGDLRGTIENISIRSSGFIGCAIYWGENIKNVDIEGFKYGLTMCNRVYNCYIKNTETGFDGCNHVYGCKYFGNANRSMTAFNGSRFLTNILISFSVTDNGVGFFGCRYITNAQVGAGLYGFRLSNQIVNSKAVQCNTFNFDSCKQVQNCQSINTAAKYFNACFPNIISTSIGNAIGEVAGNNWNATGDVQ